MQALVGGCGQIQEGGLWIAMDKPLDNSSQSVENCRSGIRVVRGWWGWKGSARLDGCN